VTILVVEDEPGIRALVAAVLERAGHQAVVASNGLEGISLFRSSPERFDLVLTDLAMPVMDGHQLVQLIRETSPGARIICMSGYSERDIPPGVEFLPKPFQPSSLVACLEGT
jgi:two-component system, cell cycle sensor histidine kinase and response regulator CckA